MDTCSYSVHQGSFHNCTLVQSAHYLMLMLLSVMIKLHMYMTCFFRPLVLSKFSDNLCSLFILNILSVPGLILHLSAIAPDVSATCTLLCLTIFISKTFSEIIHELLIEIFDPCNLNTTTNIVLSFFHRV